MRRIIALAVGAAAVLTASAAIAQPACTQLTITGHPSYPPIGYRDGDQIAGAGATMLAEIGANLGIPVVPLYFAKERPMVERSGTWILVDDDRMRLEPGEEPQMKKVRFRTLGCYPLSGAVESEAETVPEVIQEMLLNRFSERQGRLIDFDEEGSMEVKKREGYF